MAISQVSKGVYVVSPAQVKKYKDTAAGEYTSVFTKERAKQWELAQKQALMNIEVGSERYKQEMLAYRDRVKSLDDQRALYQRELEDIKSGKLTAEDASRKVTARLIQDAREEKARRQELQARKSTMSAGGTSTSTTTGEGSGGRAPSARKPSLPPDQLAAIGTVVRDAGTIEQAVTKMSASRSGGLLPSLSVEMSDDQNAALVESLTDDLMSGGGLDRAEARAAVQKGLREVTGGAAIADSADRVALRLTPEEGGGTYTRITTSTRPGSTTSKPYAGLGELPELTPEEEKAIRESVSPVSRAEREKELQDAINALKAPDRPSVPQFDFITQARDIAAGRFGPTQPSPAYRERLVTQGLLTAPADVQAELVRQYRASLPTAPIEVPRAVTEGVPTPTPAPTPVPTTEVELPLQERLLLANMGRELAVPVSDKSMLETLAQTALVAPPSRFPVTPTVSTMREPELVAAPTPPLNLRTDEARAAELALLGVKPEGELVVPAGEKGEPSTAGSVKDIRPLNLPGRSPFPASPTVQLEQAKAADRFATSVEKAEDVRVATKSGLQPEVMGVKKGGPPSKVTYLQNRIEASLELKDKPGKLDRLAASGSGKVARDLYRANSSKGVPFGRTWDEITMTFRGNEDAMKRAHEIALALDMMTNDTAPKEK